MERLTADVEVCLDAWEAQAINGGCIWVKLFVHCP